MNLKVVVTGTGRCGTNFVANVLTSMGLPCGHEAIFGPEGWERAGGILAGLQPPESSLISKSGTVLAEDHEIEGESSYAAAPFLARLDTLVIHLVRNPVDVIASMTGLGFRNFAEAYPVDYEDQPYHFDHERFLYEHVPELSGEMTQIDRACLFYLRWNQMIEDSGKVSLFHRIEDPVENITRFLGLEGDPYEDRFCNSFSNTSRPWSLSDIRSNRINFELREMMRRYGYGRFM